MGVIFFEMLYGKRPFGHGMTQDQIMKKEVILSAHEVKFPPKPSISEGVKKFIKKCLTYFQDDRYDVMQAYKAINYL